MKRSGVVVVFARAPRPGRVKTRMTPPLSPGEAADLYRALLIDVLHATADFARALDLDPVVTVDPSDARVEIAGLAPPVFRVIAQRGADLSARMEWAVREAAAQGAEPILLRGSDSPAMDVEVVRAALEALEECDMAVSPDRDGGYNLVALRRPTPGLFSHAMSTATVLQDTLSCAAARGLRTRVLEPGFDLDTAADLRWLAIARVRGAAGPCPRLLALLDERDLWRRVPAPGPSGST